MIRFAEEKPDEKDKNVPSSKTSFKKVSLGEASQNPDQPNRNFRSKSEKQIAIRSRSSFSHDRTEAYDRDNQPTVISARIPERLPTDISYGDAKRLLSVPGRIKKTDDENKSMLSHRINESVATISELRRMLDGSDKQKRLNTDHVNIKKVLMENHFDEPTAGQIRQEEKEHVKGLDRWRLEIKRKKILNSMNKMSEIMNMYTKRKVKENNNIPVVNAEALNRILVESDDEEKSESARSKSTPALAKEKSKVDIDIPMNENNSTLLTALIMQKIENKMSIEEMKKLSKQELKLEIKTIVDQIIFKFRALKKYGSEVLAQNQVNIVLKKLKARMGHSDKLKNKPQEEPKTLNTEEETTVDYRMVEVALTKNMEQSIEQVESLSKRIKDLNDQNFKLKESLIQYQDQLRDLTSKKPKGAEGKYESRSSQSPQRDDRVSLNEVSDISAEQVKAMKSRHERRKQEIMLREKIAEIEQKLPIVVRERESAENDLKLARDSKIYFKLQLKDLYYQLLKDEKYLTKNKSDSSYTWIIKALWKINEDIKDQAFPTFMDSNTINFMKEFSLCQNEIEKYCKQQNLMGMLSGLDDFKQIHSKIFQDQGKQKNEEAIITIQEGLPQVSLLKFKDENEILKQFQDKMYLMKKTHIKAKRQVNVPNYNTRGRFFTTKWEDVDPSIVGDQLTALAIKPKKKDIDASTRDKTKPTKTDILPTLGLQSSAETVTAMLNKLDIIKNNEITRIIKEHIGNGLEERMVANIEKTFLFMFGRSDGGEAFRRFLKEKKMFDERNMKNSPSNKRSQSQANAQSKIIGTLPSTLPAITNFTEASHKIDSSSRLLDLSRKASAPLKFSAPPLLYNQANIILHIGKNPSRMFAKKHSVC